MAYLLIGPGETLDYSCDWTSELEAGSPSDSIATSAWRIAPEEGSPPTPTLSDLAHADTLASVKLADGTAGAVYRLTNSITTAQGLTLERSITIRCETR